MQTPKVLVVLTNWRRPENLPAIVDAFRKQTSPVSIALLDNSGDPRFAASPDLAVDERWVVDRNLGPPCRFMPAIAKCDSEFVLFYDDDCLPALTAVERLITSARSCSGRFSTIGQIGRIFSRHPTRPYVVRNVPALSRLSVVNMTCRAHFVRSDLLHHVFAFRQRLLDRYPEHRDAVMVEVGRHDDMLLCLGLQLATQWPSYILSKEDSTSLIHRELPEHDAASRVRATHLPERNSFILRAKALGWRSVGV